MSFRTILDFCVAKLTPSWALKVELLWNHLGHLEQTLGTESDSVPLLQVVGLPGTGKTFLVRTFLDAVGAYYAYVDSRFVAIPASSWGGAGPLADTFLTPLVQQWVQLLDRHLAEAKVPSRVSSALKQAKKNLHIKSLIAFMETVHECMALWAKLTLEAKLDVIPVPVLVIDHAETLLEENGFLVEKLCAMQCYHKSMVNAHVDCLEMPDFVVIFCTHRPIATRAHNFLPTICLEALTEPYPVLENLFDRLGISALKHCLSSNETVRVLPDRLEFTAIPVKVHWQSLFAEDSMETTETCLTISTLVFQQLWTLFMAVALRQFYRQTYSNFHETLLLLMRLWPVYLVPLLEAKSSVMQMLRQNELEDLIEELRAHFERHPLVELITSSALNHTLKILPSARDALPSIIPQLPAPHPSSSSIVHVPSTYFHCSPLVLVSIVSGYLCSHLSLQGQRQLLGQKLSRRKLADDAVAPILGPPKPFQFMRWVAMIRLMQKSVGLDPQLSKLQMTQVMTLTKTHYFGPRWKNVDVAKLLDGTLKLTALVPYALAESIAHRLSLPLAELLMTATP